MARLPLLNAKELSKILKNLGKELLIKLFLKVYGLIV